MGVAEGDGPAFSIAQALIQGAQTDFSLRQVPRLDPERADDVPCRVACVSRPVPGWIRSYLLRPRARRPTRKGVLEVHSNGNQGVWASPALPKAS